MSALLTPGILRELELENGRIFGLDPADRCRFCGCQEDSPCAIPLREGQDGTFYLASSECETTMILPCSWFVPGVCNAPECIEKLLIEARGKVVLFGGDGRRTG